MKKNFQFKSQGVVDIYKKAKIKCALNCWQAYMLVNERMFQLLSVFISFNYQQQPQNFYLQMPAAWHGCLRCCIVIHVSSQWVIKYCCCRWNWEIPLSLFHISTCNYFIFAGRQNCNELLFVISVCNCSVPNKWNYCTIQLT